MKRQATLAHLLGPTESFSRSQPIKNKHLKGKNTKGMVAVKMRDENNTVIFCESEEEAERVKPIYEFAMLNTEDKKRAIVGKDELFELNFRNLKG